MGSGADWSAESSPGTVIGTAIGEFQTVSGVTSEEDDSSSNDYSIQLNTNTFGCSTVYTDYKQATCWEQFVFENPGTGLFQGGSLFIEYALINYASTYGSCPSNPSPGSSWNDYDDLGTCYSSSSTSSTSAEPITNLGNLVVGVTVDSETDQFELTDTAAGSSWYLSLSDSVFDLSQYWDEVEFNVVGNGDGSQASFNSGSSITVWDTLYSTSDASMTPTCTWSGQSGTGETNNLNLGLCYSIPPSNGDSMSFTEFSQLPPQPALTGAICNDNPCADDPTIILGHSVTIRVTAANIGSTAPTWQTIALSFPSDPPSAAITVGPSNLSGTPTLYTSGATMTACYSSCSVTLTYPLVQGLLDSWRAGASYYMTVNVTPSQTGTFTFYLKSVAGIAGASVAWAPSSASGSSCAGNTCDQQHEFVTAYIVHVVEPAISLSPSQGVAGTSVGISGTGFSPGASISLSIGSGASISNCGVAVSAGGSFSCQANIASGTPATYTVTANGSDSPVDGASALFTVDQTGGFYLESNPPSISVSRGGSASGQLTVTSVDGYSDIVVLAATGLPGGVLASFSPGSGTPTFSSSLLFSASSAAAVGTFDVTITGTGTDGSNFELSVPVTVSSPGSDSTSTSVTPSPWSVSPYGVVVYTLTVTDLSGDPSPPSGSVDWSDGGAGGTFTNGPTCELGATGTSTSACAIDYNAPSSPESVTIVAHYLGDATHQASSGQASLTVLSTGGSSLCGAHIYSSLTLESDVNCDGNGILIQGPTSGITLNCAGYSIDGLSGGVAIYLNFPNSVTVENCEISGFQIGVEIGSGSHNVVTDTTVDGSSFSDFLLSDATTASLTYDSATGSQEYGYRIEDCVCEYTGNNLEHDSATGNALAGWYFYGDYQETVLDDTAIANGGDGFYDTGDRDGSNFSGDFASGNNGSGFDLSGIDTVTFYADNATDNVQDGFGVDSSSSGLVFKSDVAQDNSRWGFSDGSLGSGTSGTADNYTQNTCRGDVVGSSDPSGLCRQVFGAILTANPAKTQVGGPSILEINVSSGAAPVTWTLTMNGSSANITQVTGNDYAFTPIAAGTYVFYLNATDAHGVQSKVETTVEVEPALVASLTAVPNTTQVGGYTVLTMGLTNGVAPISWTLTINGSSANITGAGAYAYTFFPHSAGNFVFFLNATDAVGSRSDAVATVVVEPGVDGAESFLVGGDPDQMAYDPSNSELFVANYYTSSISVLNLSSDSIVSTISLPYSYTSGEPYSELPGGVAYDPALSEVFVSVVSYDWAAIDVIDPSSNSIVASMGFPSSDANGGPGVLTVDPSSGTLFVVDTSNIDIYQYLVEYSISSQSVVGTTTVCSASCYANGNVIYVPQTGNVYVNDGTTVTAVSAATYSVAATYTIDASNGGSCYGNYYGAFMWGCWVAYSPVTGYLYADSDDSYDLYAINATSGSLAWKVSAGTCPLGIAYGAVTNYVYVTSASSGGCGGVGQIQAFNGTNGVLEKTIGGTPYSNPGVYHEPVELLSRGGYVCGDGSGNPGYITCFADVEREITGYIATFSETGLPSGSRWWVNLTGGLSLIGNTSKLSTTLPNGTYTYTVAPYSAKYAATGGLLTVNGGQVSEPVAFSLITYAVKFTESGLTRGTAWSLTVVGNRTYGATTTLISFSEPNGTYDFTVSPASGYSPNVTSGEFTVSGGTVTESVTFSAVATYALTFSESGLKAGAAWSVTLNGILLNTTNATMTVNEPNGSYSYEVGPIDGYTATPSSGNVTVNGSAEGVTVVFRAIPYTVTFDESGLASTVLAKLGWTVVLNGRAIHSNSSVIVFGGVHYGTYPALVTGPSGWATSTSGSVTVVSNATVPVILAKGRTYTLSFTEKGLKGQQWCVEVDGLAKCATEGPARFLNLTKGPYSYGVVSPTQNQTISAKIGPTAVPTLGRLSLSKSLIVSLTFSYSYAVTFSEQGLPSDVSWSITVHGRTMSAPSGTSIVFELTNATYAWKVGKEPGYLSNHVPAKLRVDGTALVIIVEYTVKKQGGGAGDPLSVSRQTRS